ncbi:MAG: flagellar hook-associated protein FlgK [Rhizobiaceae bacterium]|nr:flagellar hook-associated protein FlgK [Rhizobiaceae bacterium]
MSLSTALNIAQSALQSTSRQTSIVSRNVADAQNPDYSRRTAVVVSTAPGARVVQIQRAASEVLFRQNLSALSSAAGQKALSSGLDRLDMSVNGVDNSNSAAAAIGKLQEAMQLYSATPSNRNLADNAVNAARDVVRTLNEGTQAIQSFRAQNDAEIANAVDDLNSLLSQFEDNNKQIQSGTRAGRDVSDALDRRDSLLKKIAEYVPISTFTRGDNDMVITTKDGTMLFETVPRSVTFTPTPAYAAGTTGNPVYIDGVPIVATPGAESTASGRIAGLVQLRDGVATTMQGQLDEVARGLISAFAESDASGGPLPDAPGLFTWPGAPAMPAAGTLVNGLARSISVNPLMDSNAGGNPELLRDGGANGAGYVANSAGASYSELLIQYADRLETPIAFDPAAGIGNSASVSAYSSNSIGWLQGLRKDASNAVETTSALATRSAEALSNETGVNVDNELSLLLDLEHTYEASARLIKAVDDMLVALLAAVR